MQLCKLYKTFTNSNIIAYHIKHSEKFDIHQFHNFPCQELSRNFQVLFPQHHHLHPRLHHHRHHHHPINNFNN